MSDAAHRSARGAVAVQASVEPIEDTVRPKPLGATLRCRRRLRRHIRRAALLIWIATKPRAGKPAPVFTEHRAGMRSRLFALVVALAAVAGSAGYVVIRSVIDGGDAATTVSDDVPGGPFALVDGTGASVSDQTYRGKWLLVFFGYTFCPDVCPTTLQSIADALERLGNLADRVQPLFITVDPKRDTPAVIGEYVRNFDPRIIGLTGSAEAIAAVAHEYRVYYAVQRTGDGPDDYLMDHSAVIYVMNPDGKLARMLAGNISGAQLAAKLRPLLSPQS